MVKVFGHFQTKKVERDCFRELNSVVDSPWTLGELKLDLFVHILGLIYGGKWFQWQMINMSRIVYVGGGAIVLIKKIINSCPFLKNNHYHFLVSKYHSSKSIFYGNQEGTCLFFLVFCQKVIYFQTLRFFFYFFNDLLYFF